jgi:hypothetical protein
MDLRYCSITFVRGKIYVGSIWNTHDLCSNEVMSFLWGGFISYVTARTFQFYREANPNLWLKELIIYKGRRGGVDPR